MSGAIKLDPQVVVVKSLYDKAYGGVRVRNPSDAAGTLIHFVQTQIQPGKLNALQYKNAVLFCLRTLCTKLAFGEPHSEVAKSKFREVIVKLNRLGITMFSGSKPLEDRIAYALKPDRNFASEDHWLEKLLDESKVNILAILPHELCPKEADPLPVAGAGAGADISVYGGFEIRAYEDKADADADVATGTGVGGQAQASPGLLALATAASDVVDNALEDFKTAVTQLREPGVAEKLTLESKAVSALSLLEDRIRTNDGNIQHVLKRFLISDGPMKAEEISKRLKRDIFRELVEKIRPTAPGYAEYLMAEIFPKAKVKPKVKAKAKAKAKGKAKAKAKPKRAVLKRVVDQTAGGSSSDASEGSVGEFRAPGASPASAAGAGAGASFKRVRTLPFDQTIEVKDNEFVLSDDDVTLKLAELTLTEAQYKALKDKYNPESCDELIKPVYAFLTSLIESHYLVQPSVSVGFDVGAELKKQTLKPKLVGELHKCFEDLYGGLHPKNRLAYLTAFTVYTQKMGLEKGSLVEPKASFSFGGEIMLRINGVTNTAGAGAGAGVGVVPK